MLSISWGGDRRQHNTKDCPYEVRVIFNTSVSVIVSYLSPFIIHYFVSRQNKDSAHKQGSVSSGNFTDGMTSCYTIFPLYLTGQGQDSAALINCCSDIHNSPEQNRAALYSRQRCLQTLHILCVSAAEHTVLKYAYVCISQKDNLDV